MASTLASTSGLIAARRPRELMSKGVEILKRRHLALADSLGRPGRLPPIPYVPISSPASAIAGPRPLALPGRGRARRVFPVAAAR